MLSCLEAQRICEQTLLFTQATSAQLIERSFQQPLLQWQQVYEGADLQVTQNRRRLFELLPVSEESVSGGCLDKNVIYSRGRDMLFEKLSAVLELECTSIQKNIPKAIEDAINSLQREQSKHYDLLDSKVYFDSRPWTLIGEYNIEPEDGLYKISYEGSHKPEQESYRPQLALYLMHKVAGSLTKEKPSVGGLQQYLGDAGWSLLVTMLVREKKSIKNFGEFLAEKFKPEFFEMLNGKKVAILASDQATLPSETSYQYRSRQVDVIRRQ
jgi:hypothetical protein